MPYIVDTVSKITANDLAKLPLEQINKTLTGYMLRTEQMLHADANMMRALEEQGETSDIGEVSNDWLGFPLKKGNKILGALVIQTYDPNRFYRQKDIDLMQFVSQHVATALARKQSDEALKKSENKLSEILGSTRDLIYKLNLTTHQYEFVSQSVEDVIGYSIEESLTMDLKEGRDHIHPDDRKQ